MKTTIRPLNRSALSHLLAVALLALFSSGVASAQSLFVGLQDNGYVRYYNPQNNSAGFVNAAGAYTGGQTSVSTFASGSDYYTLSLRTADSIYAVSSTSFASVNTTLSGSLSLSFTQNVATNATTDTLVDFARVGTDFFFLSSTGKIYQNSSTTALYDLGTTFAGTYSSLAVVGGTLLAGAYDNAGNHPDHTLTVSGTPVNTTISAFGGTGGGLELAGDATSLYFVRQDSLAYQTSNGSGNYRGNFGATILEAGVGVNSTTGINTLYGIRADGTVRYGDATTNGTISTFTIPLDALTTMVGASVVTVVPEPTTTALLVAALLGMMCMRQARRARQTGN